MRKLWLKIIFVISLFILFELSSYSHIFADNSCSANDPCSSVSSAYERVNCYTNIVNICASQRESMVAQVAYLSGKIELSKAKIEAAKEKIISLEKEI